MLRPYRWKLRPERTDHSVFAAELRDSHTLRYLMGALCAVMVFAMLGVGLWPFHSPKNQVSWVPNEDSVRFGRNGTILSSGMIRYAGPDRPSCSLENWIEPALVWTRCAVLSFYNPQNPTGLSLHQDYAKLVVQRGTPNQRNGGSPPQIEVEDLFRKPQIFLTITSDGQYTAIYINGRL